MLGGAQLAEQALRLGKIAAAVEVISLVPGTAHAKTITETIDDTGDGGGNLLDGPQGIAVDGSGNVYRQFVFWAGAVSA